MTRAADQVRPDASFARAVKERATALGFDACGIARAVNVDPDNRLKDWVARGFHANMDWMATTADLRADIRLKCPGARSVVVVARNYYAERPESMGSGRVSRYAWGRDYHRVLSKPLCDLADTIHALELENAAPDEAPPRYPYLSVDTGPVLERAYAARAGIGWIGKNALLLREDIGSWFFLGLIATRLELASDSPVENRCGSCTRCMEACPTDAIVEPGLVDARRCISYCNKRQEEIPTEIQQRMGYWLFGCDVCQEVCPWNRTAKETTEPDFLPHLRLASPNIDEWLNMDEAEFARLTRGTPVRGIKYAGMQRNLRIADHNRRTT